MKKSRQIIGVVGRLGGDKLGQTILSQLQQYGVDTQGIEIARGEKTAWFELHEIGKTSAQRMFRGSLEAGDTVVSLPLPPVYRIAYYIHLATAPPKQQILWFKRYNSQTSPHTKISIDAFEAYARKNPKETYEALCLATGYIFINEEEWKTVALWLKKRHRDLHFSVPVILKLGEKGATIIYPNMKAFHVCAKKVHYVNGTGAGETLASVFLTLRAQGVDEKHALKKAVYYASLSVQNFGVDHMLQQGDKTKSVTCFPSSTA